LRRAGHPATNQIEDQLMKTLKLLLPLAAIAALLLTCTGCPQCNAWHAHVPHTRR